MSEPKRIGIIGAGGWAGALINLFNEHVPKARGRITVVSTSRPEQTAADENVKAQGATVVGSADELFAADLDGVIVPTSIDTHEVYTARALELGWHVLCEKPAAGTVDEIDRMIAARDKAGRAVGIAFQDTFSASIQWAKQQILGGAIGKVKRAKVWACWPRSDSYYQRNSWAGALERDGRWILDSPANNAMGHQVNILSYLTGPDATTSNAPTQVEAELYRAREIDYADTCAFRVATEAGCSLLYMLSHACRRGSGPFIEIEGEQGTIRRSEGTQCELIRDGAVIEAVDNGPGAAHGPMYGQFLDAMNGGSHHMDCELENARTMTTIINGAAEASSVHTIDKAHWERVPWSVMDPNMPIDNADTDCAHAVTGMEETMQRCYDAFVLPSECDDVAWVQAAGTCDVRGYKRFGGPKAS
ncbi:MAG: hypothetical protein CMJ49_13965 [Planctomycetaceae bacterium]|nr:hypothetical protein [Planctomycetaceae bacterium]